MLAIAEKICGNTCAPWSVEILKKMCISLKIGCYLVKVQATYIRGELYFQSDAQIYIKKTVNMREKLI